MLLKYKDELFTVRDMKNEFLKSKTEYQFILEAITGKRHKLIIVVNNTPENNVRSMDLIVNYNIAGTINTFLSNDITRVREGLSQYICIDTLLIMGGVNSSKAIKVKLTPV